MTDPIPDDERFEQADGDLLAVLEAIDEADHNALLNEDLKRLLEIREEIHAMHRTYRESRPDRTAVHCEGDDGA